MRCRPADPPAPPWRPAPPPPRSATPGAQRQRRGNNARVPKLSVTIITLNEADHIAAAIDSASWADEVIVVDSGSTDATVAIARSKGARVDHRNWTGWIDQKNHAASLATHDWIFSLD